jgi:uncharacterized integral membrane protein
MNFKLIFILILACLAVIFIIQNVEVVEIRFLIWFIQMSRSLFVFILVALGIIIGWSLNSFFRHRKAKNK